MMNNKKNMQQPVVTFRHWERKNYAVFSTLKRVVKICGLGVACSLVMHPVMTTAQNDSLDIAKKIDMDEVVVSASRTPMVYSQAARVVTVITREEIAAMPVQSIDALLEHALNVDVRQRGTYGMQADVSIRGGSFDQTLVLLNGINISDPQTGHHNLDLPIDLGSVERVEILEGPAARVFGANAFSGVINIITNEGSKKGAMVELAGGEHGLYKGVATVHAVTGKVKHFISGSYAGSDGYIENTDFEGGNMFYHGTLEKGKQKLDVQLAHAEKSFGANSFYTPAYPNQYEATRTTMGSVKLQSSGQIKVTPALYWRRHNDRFELFRGDAPAWYKSHNYHVTDAYGGNVNIVIPSRWGKTSLGADVRMEDIKSNVLGEEMDQPEKVPGTRDAYYSRSHSRTNISLFAEHNFYWHRFTLSGGVMANVNSDLGEHLDLFPGVDFSVRISDALNGYASFNKSLRMPNYTDLYYVGPNNLGNADLKPEEAVTIETGVKYNVGVVTGHVALFKRYGTNMIDWVKEQESDKWQSRNLTEINTSGIEASARIHMVQWLGSRQPLRMVNLSYGYLQLDKQSGDFISKYVMDNLRHKLSGDITLALYKGLLFNTRVSYQDREGSYIAYTDGSYGAETAYEPFWLCDVRLSYKRSRWEVYVEAANLLDADYFDLGNVPQPGRWLRGGVKVTVF